MGFELTYLGSPIRTMAMACIYKNLYIDWNDYVMLNRLTRQNTETYSLFAVGKTKDLSISLSKIRNL